MFKEIEFCNPKKDSDLEKIKLFTDAYRGSQLSKEINIQRDGHKEVSALFTDIDDTFFKAGREKSMKELTDNLRENNIPLIAVTGNDYKRILDRIKSGELPCFDVIVGSVGTEIFFLHKNEDDTFEYKRDKYFDEMLGSCNFDRREIVGKSIELIETLSGEMPECEFNFQNLQTEESFLLNQSTDYQPYKVSFYFFADEESLDKVVEIVSDKFSDKSIIICEEIGYNSKLSPEDKKRKYCLDILPLTKGDAVNYLSKMTGIDQGVVSGDSGNDVRMLLDSSNLNAVLVGGYKQEALKNIKKEIEESPHSNWRHGKRSFQKIVRSDGTVKNIYIEPEPNKRQASESILRAASILMRAESIFKKKKE